MKLLLQFNNNNKIRDADNFEELQNVIQQTYMLKPMSYLLQKFDPDFDEYVDIEDGSYLCDKDKIRVISVTEPEVASNAPEECSLNFSSEELYPAVSIQEVILPHVKQWPDVIELPFENFSQPLREDLEAERSLSWDRSRELIGHLANYAYSYKPYPNKADRLDICHSLARKFPYLRNNIGIGIGGWELKLLNKLKKMRQSDVSLEVKRNRPNSAKNSNFPPKNIIIPKKGELNWAPDHVLGENADSIKLHKKILKDESLKSEKDQDKDKISTLMSLSYSFRREQINNKILVNDLKFEYPIFFQMNEQLEEFKRLTAVSIKEKFYQETSNQGPELYMIFKKKKKTIEESNVLTNFNEEYMDTDSIKKGKAETSFGIFIIPYLLREKIDCIYKVIDDDDCTPDYESSFPKIYGTGSLTEGEYVIICEGVELSRTSNFLDAVCLLISFYYTLNISFPILAINTLKFIQNSILKIRGGSIPPKVKTLINKIEAVKKRSLQMSF